MGDQFVVFANGLVECEKLAELAVCREAHERVVNESDLEGI